jgi:uncharacterized protein YndB with AHSA1/START domain
MGTLRRAAVLPLPPAQVFEALTVPENARKVMRGVTRFEPLDPGPMGLGSRFLQTRVVRGMAVDVEVEVVAFEPAHRLALAGEARGVAVRFEYEMSAVPGGTRVALTCEVQGAGPLRLVTPMITAVVAREEDQHLERLAALVAPQSSPSMTSV